MKASGLDDDQLSTKEKKGNFIPCRKLDVRPSVFTFLLNCNVRLSCTREHKVSF